VKRGEVWEIGLDPSLDAEIKNIRPCVIVSRDALARLPLRIIVPLTAWRDEFESASWHVPIESSRTNGLTKKSSADTFQVRSVSTARFIRHIGRLSDAEMKLIGKGLALCQQLELSDQP